MTKIVYNSCYGGFSLSDEAVELYLTLRNMPLTKEVYSSTYSLYYVGGDYFSSSLISRTDPYLVQVVEVLGERANGKFADLKIVEVPEGCLYRINKYDGNESVMTIEDYDWEVA